MVIYAEYLFLENALVGLVVLLLTKKFCGCFVSWNRLAVGRILCGFTPSYSFWKVCRGGGAYYQNWHPPWESWC